MALESTGFDVGVREDPSVFVDRLETFPAGFVVREKEHRLDGYLCSERWSAAAPRSAAGFVVGHSARARHDPRGSVLYVSSMTLGPAARGHGAGRRFFATAMDRILGAEADIETCLLIVNETWIPARRIYAAEGYAEVERIPAFFTPLGCVPEDAIVMTRRA